MWKCRICNVLRWRVLFNIKAKVMSLYIISEFVRKWNYGIKETYAEIKGRELQYVCSWNNAVFSRIFFWQERVKCQWLRCWNVTYLFSAKSLNFSGFCPFLFKRKNRLLPFQITQSFFWDISTSPRSFYLHVPPSLTRFPHLTRHVQHFVCTWRVPQLCHLDFLSHSFLITFSFMRVDLIISIRTQKMRKPRDYFSAVGVSSCSY